MIVILLRYPTIEQESYFTSQGLHNLIYSRHCNLFLILFFLQLKGYQLMGIVMAVEASKVPAFRDELKSLISES